MIHEQQSIEAFNSSVIEYENTISKLENYNHTYDYLIELLEAGSSILDLACGPGNISYYLSKRKKIYITGFDLSEKMIALAQKKNPQGTFKVQSIESFSAMDKYDAVICGFGIPFLNTNQLLSCIECVYSCLKSDGLFYVSFMEGTGEGFESPSFNPNVSIYFHYHEKNTVEKLLKNTGFSIIKTYNLDYIEKDGSVSNDIIYIVKK
jgi:predicted TPR repeat methyltransferase